MRRRLLIILTLFCALSCKKKSTSTVKSEGEIPEALKPLVALSQTSGAKTFLDDNGYQAATEAIHAQGGFGSACRMVAAGIRDKGQEPLVRDTCGRSPVLQGLCAHYFKSGEESIEAAVAALIKVASTRSDKNVPQTATDVVRQKIHDNFIESATLCVGVSRDLGVQDPLSAAPSAREKEKQRETLISALFGPIDEQKYSKAVDYTNALNAAVLTGETTGIALAEQTLKSYNATSQSNSDSVKPMSLEDLQTLAKDAAFASFYDKNGAVEGASQGEVFAFESGRKTQIFMRGEDGTYSLKGQCPTSVNRKACADTFTFDPKEQKEKYERLARLEGLYTKLVIAAAFVPGGSTVTNIMEKVHGEQVDNGMMALDAAADVATIFWLGAKAGKVGSRLRALEELALRTATYANLASSAYGFGRLSQSIANAEDPGTIIRQGGETMGTAALFWALYYAGSKGKARLREIRLGKVLDSVADGVKGVDGLSVATASKLPATTGIELEGIVLEGMDNVKLLDEVEIALRNAAPEATNIRKTSGYSTRTAAEQAFYPHRDYQLYNVEYDLGGQSYKLSFGFDVSINPGKGYRGVEFKSPIMHTDLDTAVFNRVIDQLRGSAGLKATPNSSGIHVHIGADSLNSQELHRLIRLYGSVEDEVIKAFKTAETRKQYALPMSKNLKKLLSETTELNRQKAINATGSNILTSQQKYRALNLRTLNSFGTIEFRLFNSSVNATQLRDITRFCQELVEMVKRGDDAIVLDLIAKGETNPKAIIDALDGKIGALTDEGTRRIHAQIVSDFQDASKLKFGTSPMTIDKTVAAVAILGSTAGLIYYSEMIK